MVEVYDFPDGRLEVRWKGRPLPYSIFDKLQRVSHAAIVENKRLGEILAWIKEQQDRQPGLSSIPEGPRRSDQGPAPEGPSLANDPSRQIEPKIIPQKPAPLRYVGLRGAVSRPLTGRLVTFQLCRNSDISTLLQHLIRIMLDLE